MTAWDASIRPANGSLHQEESIAKFPNESSANDQKFVPREEVELPETEEERLRSEANKTHAGRFLGQILFACVIIAIAAGAVLFWMPVATSEPTTKFSSVITFFKNIAANNAVVTMIQIILVGVLGAYVFILLVYLDRRTNDWNQYKAEAAANDPETSANGYMEIFRVYAKSKRRAIYSIIFGLALLWWSFLGAMTMWEKVIIQGDSYIAGGLILLQAILSVAVIYLGGLIGRSFLPGGVLVHNTLVITFRAATSQTHYDRARQEAIRVENEIKKDRPWWFF